MADQLASLKLLLLVGVTSRLAATQHVTDAIQQTATTLTEKGHGKATVVVTTLTQEQTAEPSTQKYQHDVNGTTAAAASDADESVQIASVAAEAADLQKAVTKHQDAVICSLIWRKLVYLAEPAGQQFRMVLFWLFCFLFVWRCICLSREFVCLFRTTLISM